VITGKKFILSCAAMSVQVLACQKMNSPEAQGRAQVRPSPVQDGRIDVVVPSTQRLSGMRPFKRR